MRGVPQMSRIASMESDDDMIIGGKFRFDDEHRLDPEILSLLDCCYDLLCQSERKGELQNSAILFFVVHQKLYEEPTYVLWYRKLTWEKLFFRGFGKIEQKTLQY